MSSAATSDRRVRRLGAIVVGVYLVFGVAELVTHLDEPRSLWFWVPALFGGAALVWLGVFRLTGNPASFLLVLAGVVIASLATVWTIVIPVVAIALVVLVARRPPAAAAS